MDITRRGRFWAVHDQKGQLVCLAVYKKGAREVVRRLSPATPTLLGKPRCKPGGLARHAASALSGRRLSRSRRISRRLTRLEKSCIPKSRIEKG